MKITLKTAKFYGPYQVGAILLFAIGIPYFIWQFYIQGSFERNFYVTLILVIGFAFFFWRIVVGLGRSWFTDAFTIEIDGEQIRYRNLFGVHSEIRISEIIRAENIRDGFIGLAFYTRNGLRFAPNLNIDYLYYVYDYIFERISDECIFDSDEMLRYRADPSYWVYERHTYHGANYSKDEILRIESAVKKQWRDLVARGILKSEDDRSVSSKNSSAVL